MRPGPEPPTFPGSPPWPTEAPRRSLHAAAAILLGLLLVGLLAPWIAPHDPTTSLDAVQGSLLPPLSQRWLSRDASGRSRLAPTPLAEDQPPIRLWLGTDRFGRDVLSRLLWGSRTSLLFGLVAAAVALGLGGLLGILAGWAGGWPDRILVHTIDAALTVPALLVLLVVAAMFRPSPLELAALVGGWSWMGTARIARAEIRRQKEQGYILAAQASGIAPSRILLRHALPHTLPPLLVDASLRVADAILLEAALSFLGLGISPPIASWGNMVAEASTDLLGAWWLAVIPGAAIALTAAGFNLAAEGLADRLRAGSQRITPRC